uniref:Putative secreted protein n=1 Tax=Anopheles marajoara TaxID=58244 RepID=A0A2M4CGI7_9DIPT
MPSSFWSASSGTARKRWEIFLLFAPSVPASRRSVCGKISIPRIHLRYRLRISSVRCDPRRYRRKWSM